MANILNTGTYGGGKSKVILDVAQNIDELQLFKSGFNYGSLGFERQSDGSYKLWFTTGGTGGNCCGISIPEEYQSYKVFIIKFRNLSLTEKGSIALMANCKVDSSRNAPYDGELCIKIPNRDGNYSLGSCGWSGEKVGDTIGIGFVANGATDTVYITYLALLDY